MHMSSSPGPIDEQSSIDGLLTLTLNALSECPGGVGGCPRGDRRGTAEREAIELLGAHNPVGKPRRDGKRRVRQTSQRELLRALRRRCPALDGVLPHPQAKAALERPATHGVCQAYPEAALLETNRGRQGLGRAPKRHQFVVVEPIAMTTRRGIVAAISDSRQVVDAQLRILPAGCPDLAERGADFLGPFFQPRRAGEIDADLDTFRGDGLCLARAQLAYEHRRHIRQRLQALGCESDYASQLESARPVNRASEEFI